MRKRDVDETTQGRLDVVGEVVAVGAEEKRKRKKQMSQSKLINRAGPGVADWWFKLMVVLRRWAKFVVLA